MKQHSLFKLEKSISQTHEWGTFKDSLRAPIHDWFTYPAGFSYKAVEFSFHNHKINQDHVIYDPFMGSGTTNLVAKKLAIHSYGIEAHPFVFRITKAKMNWEIYRHEVSSALQEIETYIKKQKPTFDNVNIEDFLQNEFPELVLKCYENNTLLDLFLIRDAILTIHVSETLKEFLFVGLTHILRQISTAATGWPYIAPNKQKTTSLNKNAWSEFSRQIQKMVEDVHIAIHEAKENYSNSTHHLFNADSRNTQNLIPNSCIDHVFTSPPYLNNFDYADRTRLELYFWGMAKNWGEISDTIRTKLITSATTQISRGDSKYELSTSLQQACPEVFSFLNQAIVQLGEIRVTRGGKKSYDLLVSGYFNDMFQVISEVYRVLKPNTQAVFILGDSAPYGVYIPTDDLIGKIGLGIGFSDYKIDILRERGGKWKDNPQRHNVQLRESIVTLYKGKIYDK